MLENIPDTNNVTRKAIPLHYRSWKNGIEIYALSSLVKSISFCSHDYPGFFARYWAGGKGRYQCHFDVDSFCRVK